MNEEIRKNENIHENDLETVSGGKELLAHFVPGLAEDEANAQKDISISTASGMTCPRCGFRMKPTVPIQGIVPSGPGFVCPTCGYVK